MQTKINKRINEEIQTLCGFPIKAPIREFEEFFQVNRHLKKEISFSYGFILAFVETKMVVLNKKQEEIFELMAEYFDSI